MRKALLKKKIEMNEIGRKLNLTKTKVWFFEKNQKCQKSRMSSQWRERDREERLSTSELRRGHNYRFGVDSKKSEINTKFKLIN